MGVRRWGLRVGSTGGIQLYIFFKGFKAVSDQDTGQNI